MKSRHFLSAGLAMIFLSSCSKTPEANYQQAIESDIVETDVFLKTLTALDSGDIAKARKVAIVPVLLNLGFAQYYFTKGLASPTPEQKQEWTKVASEILDYMLKHQDEWDSQRLDVQNGMRGLRYFLTKPEDVRRLNELSGHLAENAKRALETP
jgi:hypothetical protein